MNNLNMKINLVQFSTLDTISINIPRNSLSELGGTAAGESLSGSRVNSSLKLLVSNSFSIFGLNGAGISFLDNLFQSIFLKNGCDLISDASALLPPVNITLELILKY